MHEQPFQRPIILYHEPGSARPNHQCVPRPTAVCAHCQRAVTFCIPVKSVVIRLLARNWLCLRCEAATRVLVRR
jgi:hypothetical protein